MPTAQPFTHTPRAPQVPAAKLHSNQRRFCDATGTQREISAVAASCAKSNIKCTVMRFADEDLAIVELSVWVNRSRASFDAHFTAPELRELAQRLLDAAHDIETHPAAVLTARAATEAVPA